MPIRYNFYIEHDGFTITTENGSVYSPIAFLADFQLHLKDRFKASDSECQRIISEIKRAGKSSAYLPDGKGLTALGMLA